MVRVCDTCGNRVFKYLHKRPDYSDNKHMIQCPDCGEWVVLMFDTREIPHETALREIIKAQSDRGA